MTQHDRRLKQLENRSPSKPHIVIYHRHDKYWRNNPRHDNTDENEITPEQLQEYERQYQLFIVRYDRTSRIENYE